MLRAMALTAGGLVTVTIAFAAADIPTRYVGAFPSFGKLTNITGTFTGSALVLKGTAIVGARLVPTTGRHTCTRGSPTQTRCAGTFKSDDGPYTQNLVIVVTWNSGRPVSISH